MTELSFTINSRKPDNERVFIARMRGMFPTFLMPVLKVVPITPDQAKIVEYNGNTPIGLVSLSSNKIEYIYGAVTRHIDSPDMFTACILESWRQIYKAKLTAVSENKRPLMLPMSTANTQ